MKTVIYALLVLLAISQSELAHQSDRPNQYYLKNATNTSAAAATTTANTNMMMINNDNIIKFLTKFIYLFPVGESLQCYCGGSKFCPEPIETCRGQNDVCGSVMFSVGSSK